MNIACTFRHLHKVYCTKCNEYSEFVFLKDNPVLTLSATFTAWKARGATATTVCASTATESTTGNIPDVITKYTTTKTASNI